MFGPPSMAKRIVRPIPRSTGMSFGVTFSPHSFSTMPRASARRCAAERTPGVSAALAGPDAVGALGYCAYASGVLAFGPPAISARQRMLADKLNFFMIASLLHL